MNLGHRLPVNAQGLVDAPGAQGPRDQGDHNDQLEHSDDPLGPYVHSNLLSSYGFLIQKWNQESRVLRTLASCSRTLRRLMQFLIKSFGRF